MDLTLRVITPERIALDTTANSVRIPAVDGEMGILPRHANMVAALDAGELRFRTGGGDEALFVAGGFAEVRENTVRIVTEASEVAADIDEERARRSEERARDRIRQARASGQASADKQAKLSPEARVDLLRAEASLRRAIARLRVKSSR